VIYFLPLVLGGNVVEKSDRDWAEAASQRLSGSATGGVSRRQLLSLLTVFAAAGCAAPSEGELIAKDIYIAAIESDPMFSWAPPGNLSREVTYAPLHTARPEPDQFAKVLIDFGVSDLAAIPGLVQQAKDTSLSHGYTPDGKHFAGQVLISLLVAARSDGHGFSMYFTAPA
jgi:hypothetical protein